MTITGTLHRKEKAVSINEKLTKREFILKHAENPTYPEFLKFELVNSNCDQLDSFDLGDELSIEFNLKGREWTNPEGQIKCFNSLQAWRIQRHGAGPKTEPNPMPKEDDGSDKTGDVPF